MTNARLLHFVIFSILGACLVLTGVPALVIPPFSALAFLLAFGFVAVSFVQLIAEPVRVRVPVVVRSRDSMNRRRDPMQI